MSTRQKRSILNTDTQLEGAIRRQRQRYLPRLLWILVALAISIGLAFFPRNHDAPVIKINLDKNIGEVRLTLLSPQQTLIQH